MSTCISATACCGNIPLCGDPADRKSYRLGVREIDGGRVSRHIHRNLRPGALLQMSQPRNNFDFVASRNYLAGGIGITPLLPMMRAASDAGASWKLLFCAEAPNRRRFSKKRRPMAVTYPFTRRKREHDWMFRNVSPR
ncbi:MAG: hypothetical protein WDN50_13855 [Bradyrhizobium sp.]